MRRSLRDLLVGVGLAGVGLAGVRLAGGRAVGGGPRGGGGAGGRGGGGRGGGGRGGGGRGGRGAVVCPVRAKNTSSSDGRRSVMSITLIPCSSSRRTASTRLPAPPSTGSDTRRVPR